MYRVLHVIVGLGQGGAESMLWRLLSRTDSARFASSVVSLTDEDAFESRIASLGISVYKLKIHSAWTGVKGAARLFSLTRRIGPDIIQGWMPHGNIAGLLARVVASKGVPLVWSIRQSLYDLNYETRTTARLIRLGARLSRQPEAIVYNSHTARTHHEALGFSKDRGTVIPNGFDSDVFKPSLEHRRSLRSELGIGEDARLVGLTGRFHPMKGHDTFIEAARTVRTRHPQSRFVMVGPGMDRHNADLTNRLERAGLAEATHLLGVRDDIQRIDAALDVAVSSSFTEAFPNVIGEAMSCGVPCVVTDVGDSALLVGDTGVVVPPRNPEKLASGMSRLLDLSRQEIELLGTKARQRIVSEFSLDRMAGSFSSLYLSICERRRVGHAS